MKIVIKDKIKNRYGTVGTHTYRLWNENKLLP